MNITSNGITKNSFNFVDFNQDYTCLSIGTSEGFRVFNAQPKFSEVYSQKLDGVAICEMLFTSSLVAIVGTGEDPSFTPRRLHIMNTKTQTSICELNFVTPILAVKMNRKRIVVVMETKIHIYDISTMKMLHTIDTVPNPKGLVALSASDENCYLCYPNSLDKGEIIVFDALTLQTMNVIYAHKTPLSKITINLGGTMLATASNKGTVIRVFSLPDSNGESGKQLYQFRRGSYPATLYSVAFSPDSIFLCASSETGTVHIFKLSDAAHAVSNGSSNGHSAVNPGNNNTKGGVSSYLSFDVISDMWETIPARAFASIKLSPEFQISADFRRPTLQS